VGCGNGKYLHLRNFLHEPSGGNEHGQGDCMTFGVDRSSHLIDFARTQSLQKMSSTQGKGKGKQTEVADESKDTAAAMPKAINEVAVGDALTTGFRSRAFVSFRRELGRCHPLCADDPSFACSMPSGLRHFDSYNTPPLNSSAAERVHFGTDTTTTTCERRREHRRRRQG
jgi:hypothetical protein